MSKLVFSSLAGLEQRFAVLDLVPDTHAWLKNSRGRFVYGNRLFYERFGFRTLQGLLGKCDYDIAPMHLAEKYVSDDRHVLEGGTVSNRLELILSSRGSGDWFLTSKWPVHDPHNDILGTFGLSRHLNQTESNTMPFQELRAPVEYISRYFDHPITVKSLASACNISVSALERRFRKHLGKTPRQYINDVRLDNVRQLLRETDKAIGVIAQEIGFADHSHMTRAYKKKFGITPKQERNSKKEKNSGPVADDRRY